MTALIEPACSDGVELAGSAWLGGSRDHEAAPKDMAGEYLVELTLQLYARACDMQCSRELHERAFELVSELKRRVARSQPPSGKLTSGTGEGAA